MALVSVSRALRELDNLDARITKAINAGVYVTHQVGKNPPTPFSSIDEANTRIKAIYESVNALINRRDAIKSAIVLSNAGVPESFKDMVKRIEIAKMKLTVAEVIERKGKGIEYRKQLLTALQLQHGTSQREVERVNVKLESTINDMISKAVSGDKAKITPELTKAIADPQREMGEARLVDPLNIRVLIDELEEEIRTFESEFNLALDESNVKTLIEIPD